MNEGMFQSELAAVLQPRILLKPESWLSKTTFINHLLLFNNVLVTILAEKGGGKTSFATLLQENLDPQIKAMSITARVPCNREAIIEEIANQFYLNCDMDTDVSSLVAQVNERRSHVLLLIDDAQHLPETFIKEIMLAIKNQGELSFFHVCLLSDYSLVAAVNSLSATFFNDLVHSIELGSLTESEARGYVLQRANHLRLITKPLSDVQLKQFYHQTKGNIAKINNSLESFVFNCFSKKQQTPLEVAKKVGIPVGAAAFAGICSLFISKAFIEEPQPQVPQVAMQSPVLPSQIASWQDSSTRELIVHSLAEKQNLDILSKGLAGQVPAIAERAVKSSKKYAQTKQRHKKSKNLAGGKLKQQHVAMHSKTKRISTKANEKYTVQLVASPEKIDMQRYIKNNRLLYTTAKLNHYIDRGGVWYVLTIGEYDSMTEAQQSISRLPPALMKLNPWVRNVSSLG